MTVDAASFRCGTKLVTNGNTKAEVFRKCGEPSWRQDYTQEWFAGHEHDLLTVKIVATEQWTYNLGPQKLMRHLTFKNGTLVSIQTGDYGFIRKTPERHCRPEDLTLKLSTTEVLSRCSEPYFRDTRQDRRVTILDGARVITSITIDEWTYDFGPTHFMRILTFENGELVDIRMGEKGGE